MKKKITMAPQADMPIQDYFQQYLISCTARGFAETTLKNYEGHFHCVSKFLDASSPLASLTKADIENAVAAMRERELSPNSISSYMRVFKSFINWCNSETVRVGFNGKNMPTISLKFFFGDDGRDVAIRVFSIAKVSEEKIKDACVACSKLNAKFRWIKFYLDKDNEVTASDDAVIDPYTTGEECFELLIRATDIVDKAYPEIMKMIWS